MQIWQTKTLRMIRATWAQVASLTWSRMMIWHHLIGFRSIRHLWWENSLMEWDIQPSNKETMSNPWVIIIMEAFFRLVQLGARMIPNFRMSGNLFRIRILRSCSLLSNNRTQCNPPYSLATITKVGHPWWWMLTTGHLNFIEGPSMSEWFCSCLSSVDPYAQSQLVVGNCEILNDGLLIIMM